MSSERPDRPAIVSCLSRECPVSGRGRADRFAVFAASNFTRFCPGFALLFALIFLPVRFVLDDTFPSTEAKTAVCEFHCLGQQR